MRLWFEHTVTRRRALSVIALTASASLLAACSGNAPPAASTAPTSASGPVSSAPANTAATVSGSRSTEGTPGQPKAGGTLRALSTQDLAPIDGHYHHPGNGLSSWTVYEPLITYDDDLKPQPLLAETWDQSSDAKQIAITLRKGVQFHNGREVTSDDVIYNLNRILDPKISAGIFSGFVPPETTWTPKDKYAVVITAKQPWTNVFDFLSLFNIVNKETMEGPDAKSSAVGTGPFALQEWVAGDHATFIKNKNYWQSGRPYLDGIQLNVMKDAQSQQAQFEAGAAEFTLQPSVLDYTRLKDDSNYQGITLPNAGNFFILQPNPNTKPFDDKRARQALNYTIDRKRIVDTVLRGQSTAQDLPWPAESTADEPAKQTFYNHDLDKAKALLNAAGLSNMSFELIHSNRDPAYPQIAQIIQADLASIGVSMSITQMEGAGMLARMNGHQFQAYLAGDVWANFLPVTVLTSDASLNYQFNNADFHDEQYAQLVKSLSAEVEPSKQRQLYAQINDFLLDQSFEIPIATSPTRALAVANLRGVGHRRNDFYTFTDAWLA